MLYFLGGKFYDKFYSSIIFLVHCTSIAFFFLKKFGQTQPHFTKEIRKKIDSCLEENEINVVEARNNLKILDGTCFAKCFYVDLGLISENGDVNATAFKKAGFIKDGETFVLDKCVEIVKKNGNICKSFARFHRCYLTKLTGVN